VGPREVALGVLPLEQAHLRPAEVLPGALRDVLLKPGDTILLFRSDRPPAYPGNFDPRRLTFQVRHLEIDLKGRR